MNPSKLTLAAALAVTTLAALPAAAVAETPAFAAFAAVCAQPAADYDGVTKAAAAKGWTETDAKSDANMAGVTVTNQVTKANTADKVGLVLSAWTGTKGAVKISDCTVHVAKSDFGALNGDAGAWLAFAPQEATAKRAIYRFTDAGGAHKPASTPADYDAAAGGSGLQIFTVSADANGSVLDLMIIKK